MSVQTVAQPAECRVDSLVATESAIFGLGSTSTDLTHDKYYHETITNSFGKVGVLEAQ
jgi:hypothetical protein